MILPICPDTSRYLGNDMGYSEDTLIYNWDLNNFLCDMRLERRTSLGVTKMLVRGDPFLNRPGSLEGGDFFLGKHVKKPPDFRRITELLELLPRFRLSK